jgi:hypothetical protein
MGYECTVKVERQLKSVILLDVASTEAIRKDADTHASLRKQQETEVQGLRLAEIA